MATFKFPNAIALVHLRAYGKCPDAARTIPTAFRVTTNVNSFLESGTGSKIRNTTSRQADMIDTDLYMLNHSVHKIHLDTFLAGGLDADGVAWLTGTTSEEVTTGGVTFPPSTTFSLIDPGAETVVEAESWVPRSASSYALGASFGGGAEAMECGEMMV
jgi:hypothetical protein